MPLGDRIVQHECHDRDGRGAQHDGNCSDPLDDGCDSFLQVSLGGGLLKARFNTREALAGFGSELFELEYSVFHMPMLDRPHRDYKKRTFARRTCFSNIKIDIPSNKFMIGRPNGKGLPSRDHPVSRE
jgi:hypothetical protein